MNIIEIICFLGWNTQVNIVNYLTVITVFISISYLIYRFGLFRFRFGHHRLNPNMVDVDYLNVNEFEHFLKPLFEAQGFHVDVKKSSNEDDADLILTKKGKKTVVKAQRNNCTIGMCAIEQAVQARPVYHTENVLVVTNQYYTKQAKKLAKAKRVKLIDRDKLIEMVTTYNSKRN